MNKLKNIGITALAGTLVSLSAAQAGGVSVSGSWELSYSNLNHEKVTGNKLGMNKNITFGSSGDISDGGAVTWGTTVVMNDAMSGLSSASMNINMGGIATLAYDSGTGGYGANAVDNIVPTAWEEIDAGFSTGITDVGTVSATKGVVNLTVKAPTTGTGISLSYANRLGGGHQADGATAEGTGAQGVDLVIDFVDYSAPHFGFRWGTAAQLELPEMTCKRQEKDLQAQPDGGMTELHSCDGVKDNPYAGTMYTKLQLGPLHLGTQATFKNPQATAASGVLNKRSVVAGAALVFGSAVSISYGEAWDRYRYNDRNRGLHQNIGDGLQDGISGESLGADFNEYQTTKFTGWSAAINMGPVALKGYKNNVSGSGEGGSSAPRSNSEINLSIAF